MHNDKKAYLLRSIPGDLYKTARIICLEEDITFRELVLRAIESYCKRFYQENEHDRVHLTDG